MNEEVRNLVVYYVPRIVNYMVANRDLLGNPRDQPKNAVEYVTSMLDEFYRKLGAPVAKASQSAKQNANAMLMLAGGSGTLGWTEEQLTQTLIGRLKLGTRMMGQWAQAAQEAIKEIEEAGITGGEVSPETRERADVSSEDPSPPQVEPFARQMEDLIAKQRRQVINQRPSGESVSEEDQKALRQKYKSLKRYYW